MGCTSRTSCLKMRTGCCCCCCCCCCSCCLCRCLGLLSAKLLRLLQLRCSPSVTSFKVQKHRLQLRCCLQAIAMYMPASAQHMMSQKPPKNVDLRCVLAQEPDHRLAYIRVLCIGLQAVECSYGGGEQPPIPALRLLKPWPVPSLLPPDTQGGLDACLLYTSPSPRD